MTEAYEEETLKKLQKVETDMLSDLDRVCREEGISYYAAYGSLIGALRHGGFIPWDDDMDICMFRRDYERFEGVFEEKLGDKYELMTPLRDPAYSSAVIKVMKKNTTFIPHASRAMKAKQGIFIDIFLLDEAPEDDAAFAKQARKARLYSMILFLIGSSDPEVGRKGIVGAVLLAICKLLHLLLSLWPGGAEHFFRLFQENAQKAVGSGKGNKIRYADFQSTDILKDWVYYEEIFPLQRVKFDHIMINIPHQAEKVLERYYGDFMTLPPKELQVNHRAEQIDFGEEA